MKISARNALAGKIVEIKTNVSAADLPICWR
jgi:molybdopterin-binding protein